MVMIDWFADVQGFIVIVVGFYLLWNIGSEIKRLADNVENLAKANKGEEEKVA